MDLKKALRANAETRLAFTGAGGKTSALFALASALRGDCESVLVTTTTHFSISQLQYGDQHFQVESPEELAHLQAALPPGVTVVSSTQEAAGRIAGIGGETLACVAHLADLHQAPLLVEADGSRLRPVKAPARHEPLVPDFVDTVVVTAGLSALGQPLSDKWVHRPAHFSLLSALEAGRPISTVALGRVMRHQDGGLKGIPASARKIALLNQADDDFLKAQGSVLAQDLLGAYDSILVAAMQPGGAVFSVRERIAAVILAAGGSRRMGRPKQLLEWQGRPLVVHAAETARRAGCAPVVVVTGAAGDEVSGRIVGLNVRQAHNPAWADGQSTSVKIGLAALPARTGGALFMLVDQPYVDVSLLRALQESHARSLAPVTAPLIDGQRGNPVLFDCSTFPDFQDLTGDAGGKQLFARYPVTWVPWVDGRTLLDIDSPEDYERLREEGGS